MMNAIIDRDDARAAKLLRKGADVDAVDKSGWCALHFAAQNCSRSATRLLLDAGARTDLRDSHGNSPLWRATMAWRGGEEVITLLLAAGADPDIANNAGHSPRDVADTVANYDTVQFFEGF